MAKLKVKELKKKIKKAQELERFDKKVKKKNKKAIKKIMAIVDTMNANSEMIAGVKKEHKSIDDLLDEVPHSEKKSKKSKKANYMSIMDVTIVKAVPDKIKETSKEAKKAFTVPDTIDVKPIKVPADPKSAELLKETENPAPKKRVTKKVAVEEEKKEEAK